MGEYYDIGGNSINFEEWIDIWKEQRNKRIALDKTDDVTVSTVWLGINHNYGDGPPLIFETMIFGGRYDQYQKRYATKAEALAGHEKAVALAFGKQKNSV